MIRISGEKACECQAGTSISYCMIIHFWKKCFSKQPMLWSDLCRWLGCDLHIEELMFVTFRISHLNEGTHAYKSLLKDKVNKLVNAKERKKGRKVGRRKGRKEGSYLPLWRNHSSEMNEINFLISAVSSNFMCIMCTTNDFKYQNMPGTIENSVKVVI